MGRGSERKVLNAVEANQIYPAFKTLEQSCQGLGVPPVVVPAVEHRVFETDPSLSAEIIFAQQTDNILDPPGFFRFHHIEPFLGKGIVQADGQMTAGIVEIELKIGEHPYCGQGDSLWTPAESPGCCEYLYGFLYCWIVVQRLAHPHKHRICELQRLVNPDELGEDVGGIEVPVPALPSGHTELASHSASGLR